MIRAAIAVLTPRERLAAMLVFCMIGVMAAIELVGIGAIFWFMKVVVEPAVLDDFSVLRWAYEYFSFKDRQQFTFWLGIGVIIFISVRNGFGAATLWAETRFANGLSASIGERLFRSYLARPYAFFMANEAAVLTRNIAEEVPKLVSGYVMPAFRIATDGTIALAIVLTLTIYDVGTTLVVGAAAALFAGAYLLLRKTLGNLGRRRLDLYEQRFRTAGEALSGIKDVKVLGQERNFDVRFLGQVRELARLDTLAHFIKQSPRFFLELMGFTVLMAITLYTLMRSGNAQETVGVLTLYGVAGIRLLPAINKILEGASNLRYNAAILTMLEDHLRNVPQALAHGAKQLLPFSRELALKDVRFRYDGQSEDVLKGMSLTIARNTSVGFVGPTGAGKTTVIDIIMGLLPPDSGQFQVDGQKIDDSNVAAWQANVGYVPQQIYLLDKTIKENIALGLPVQDIDMQAVRDAARLARIADFIEDELPSGYDTIVGDRGVRLSGGQRQRIGIARALYRRPSVLVLDEATSALDNITEAEISEAIAGLSKATTVITIAHRLSTVRACDSIFVLERGQLVSQGRYDDLAQSDPTFRRLATQDL